MHTGTRHTCGGRTVPKSDIQRGNVTRKEQPVTRAPSGLLLLAWSAGPCAPGSPEEGAAPAGIASLWAPLFYFKLEKKRLWSVGRTVALRASEFCVQTRDRCDSRCTS